MNPKSLLFLCTLALLQIGQTYGQTAIRCKLSVLGELTLDKSPLIRQNKLGIDQAKAAMQIQSSAFDYRLSSGLSLSHNRLNLFEMDPRRQILTDPLHTNAADFTMAIQRKLRTGLTTSLSIDYAQLSDNYPINRFNQDVGQYIPDHTTTTTFSLTQPLLRGRGAKIATAAENSASLNIETTKYDFELSSSYELLQMGIAYWQYLNANKRLEIYQRNEKRVRDVLQMTKELVEGDKKPAGDLIQIRADLTDQERLTTVAKQNLYNARLNLGRVVGLNETEVDQISDPLDEFPTIYESGFHSGITAKAMASIARKHRSDIKALEKTKEALELQFALTENELRPQLDLTGFVSYGGMDMGTGLRHSLSSLGNREGRNYMAGFSLNFSFPINNNLALAVYSQNKIALTDQLISYNDLGRNIDLNVSIALNNLKNSVLILEKTSEAVDYFQDVFDNEQVKFQNGLTTLLNLILFQERLTIAQLEFLQAQQQFAVSIINLRFETGTLITMEANKNTITPKLDFQAFYTLPGQNN